MKNRFTDPTIYLPDSEPDGVRRLADRLLADALKAIGAGDLRGWLIATVAKHREDAYTTARKDEREAERMRKRLLARRGSR
jgi:hypothetical protein